MTAPSAAAHTVVVPDNPDAHNIPEAHVPSRNTLLSTLFVDAARIQENNPGTAPSGNNAVQPLTLARVGVKVAT